MFKGKRRENRLKSFPIVKLNKHASVLNFKFETLPHPHLEFLLLHPMMGNQRKEVHTPAVSRREWNISRQCK